MKFGKKAKFATIGLVAGTAMVLSTTAASAASYISGSDVYACGGNAWLDASSSNWAFATGYGSCTVGIYQINHTSGGSKIFPAGSNEYFGDGVHSLSACFVASDYSYAIACGPEIWHS